MNVFTLIARFGETLTVERPGASTLTLGRWVAAASSALSIVMSVQPLNGDDLEELPAGQRTRNVIKGYTATELKTADEATATKADIVTYNGKAFEVQTVERWRGDLNHWKVILVEFMR